MGDVDDHGLEVLKKAAEFVDQVTKAKNDYYLKIGGIPDSNTPAGEIPPVKVDVENATFTGNFAPSGLQTEGKHQEITINETTWTALPATALTGRNQINIQNFSGGEIKVNYDPTIVGYVGMRVPNAQERFYQIQGSIPIYAKSAPGSGSVVIDIEELA